MAGKRAGRAIYHMKVRTASRSKGQSARAAASYIERTEEYGRDPESAAELVYTESGHMPGWADADAGGVAYWDAADLYERSNGRLYKSVEIALPLALSAGRAARIGRPICPLLDRRRAAALYPGHPRGQRRENPHCHLMISERTNDDIERSPETWFKRYNAAAPEEGGARKTTALHPKDWLLETRAAWAEQTNQALERAGHEIRIDHRSLEDQGIERLPGIHLGPACGWRWKRRGITDRAGEPRWLAITQTNEQLQTRARRAREEAIRAMAAIDKVKSQPEDSPAHPPDTAQRPPPPPPNTAPQSDASAELSATLRELLPLLSALHRELPEMRGPDGGRGRRPSAIRRPPPCGRPGSRTRRSRTPRR